MNREGATPAIAFLSPVSESKKTSLSLSLHVLLGASLVFRKRRRRR